MSCKKSVQAQSLGGNRPVSVQGCCPPETDPPIDEDDGDVTPGEEVNPGDDIPDDTDPPEPQPNPQPDPIVRRARAKVIVRPLTQRFPTPANRWRWRASSISGQPPINQGPISQGGTLTPGGGITEEPR